jgi:ATP-binding cassette subfamily B protein/ATP-binding cassette subfamily B protein IrtA
VPLGWFSERSSGAVKKSLQDDVHALHYLIAHARLDLVAALTVPVASLAYLFWVDWRLGVVLLLPLLGYLVAYARMMGGHNEGTMDRYAAWEQRVNASVVEFVDGIQVVRTFGQAGRAHRRFQEAVDGFSAFFAAWAGPITRLESAANVLLNPAFLLLVVMAAGTGMVGAGWVEPVALLPFVLVGLGLGATVLNLGYAAQAARQASDAAIRLAELLDAPELPVAADAAGRLVASVAGRAVPVRLDDVSFEYRPGQPVLQDVSFELRPGTITALVGPSGSGKSTLARLLPRFFDVTAGSVTVDGVDVRQADPAELYRMVGFVFQDVRLIRGTIRDNIALGRPDATDEQVAAAARAAQLHDRVLELPAGYAAEVGVDVRLSGGEAQRLSIARALLADPPILVLDEATAFADPESEAAIQDALATLVAGRTVLVIAHRLHTVVDVDEILVLDGGRLVERGTHPALLEAGGLYRRLWDANEAAVDALAAQEEAR